MSNKDELLNLANTISQGYGRGSLMLLGDSPQVYENQVNRISTGLHELDWCSGGGLVKGTQVELSGPEAGGKTTLALSIIAECQKMGMQAHYIDAEHKLNIDYAEMIGVDVANLLFTQPQYGEHAVDVMQATIQSGLVDVMVVDSVTALVPLAEINGDTTDVNMGAHARLMSKMCRVLTPLISMNHVLVIYINQIRHKIGVQFGSPETTTGGNALKFYCGVRARVSSSQYKKGEEVDTTRRMVTVNFVKNQWGVPYRKTDLLLDLGVGFNKGYDVITAGLREGILIKKSSHVAFCDGEVLGNGIFNAGQNLIGNEYLLAHYHELLRNKYAVTES